MEEYKRLLFENHQFLLKKTPHLTKYDA